MTKKTALGVTVILIPFALALAAVWWNIGAMREALARANASPDTVRSALGVLSQLRWIADALFVCAALIAVGFVLFLSYFNFRPLQEMSQALRQGDISADVDARNNEVCREYNGFVKKLRNILGHTRKIGLDVAVGSTEVARAVKDLRAKGKKNGDLSEAIFFASMDMSHRIIEVSQSSHSLHQSAATNLAIAKSSLEELKKVGNAIARTGNSATQFAQNAERLIIASKHVKEMSNLIDDVSSQLHNLALKTSANSRQAGDKSLEFAELAAEIERMAERTSAGGSSEVLVNMMCMVRDVQNMGSGIHDNMEGMSTAVNKTIGHFNNLVRVFEDNKDQLSAIGSAVEVLSSKNAVIHAQVTDSRELSKQVETVLADTALAATSMNRKTEALLEAVSQFRIGNDGLEHRIAEVTAYRDLIQSKIADMLKRGIDVFDRKYRLIPKTDPQKFHTAYDSHFDKELQVVFDRAIQEMDAVYCVAVDINGYIATHHSRVSRPLTGNYETDLLFSRDKRMYNTVETEIRRFKNTNPFLLQTYMRDTGEILNDFAMPVYVEGKHWGCVVAGFQPQKLLLQQSHPRPVGQH
jgi:methyl-accepting chemotaxis protein